MTALVGMPPAVHAVENPHEVFIGSYALQVDHDFGSEEASGLQLGYAYDVTEHFGVRGSYYSLEHDTISGLDSTGFDLSLLGGLLGAGFNIFGGGGLFSEEWEANGVSEDFSGLQITLGIGYSWEHVQLSLVGKGRQPSDYEEFYNNVTASSGSLSVGYRF